MKLVSPFLGASETWQDCPAACIDRRFSLAHFRTLDGGLEAGILTSSAPRLGDRIQKVANPMKLSHINVVARDAGALANFYQAVFNLELLREPRTLSGDKVSRGNGVPNSVIRSIWLRLPGADAPFLEIHEHETTHGRGRPEVNEPGFGHLAFSVEDISATLATLIEAGGSQIGEITDFGSAEKPLLIVYTRDIEGNILELEQP